MRRTASTMAFCLLLSGLSCAPSGQTSRAPGSPRPGVATVEAPPAGLVLARQTLYVPMYSHVYTADGASPLNLAATLFVRNTDQSGSIIVTRVEYFNSNGKSLRSLIKSPLKIDALASIDFFVQESDETGGASPSFVVEWVATSPVANPLVETIMIGTTGSQGISFTCPARVLPERGLNLEKPASATPPPSPASG